MCECCGVEFVAKKYNQRFCKEECRYKYHKELYKNNPEYNLKLRKDNKLRHKKGNIKKCIVCGKSFTANPINTKICSYECRSKYWNKQWRLKNKNNLDYKLKMKARQFIYRCLNSKKTKHTFDILGYTPEMLKQRLEINFKSDMNWSNHGTLWHIDHIKPLCKFNFVLPDGTPDYEQIRLANSLANLKPLYVQENLSKGGR